MKRFRAIALTGAAISALGLIWPAPPLHAQDIVGAGNGGRVPGPALAPTAQLIGTSPVADGTAATSAPSVASRRNVTIRDRAATAEGEDAATVLADQIVLTGDRTLIAAGGVVIWYQGARLVASRLVVDGASGDLTLEGPIHLSQPADIGTEDENILIADSAQLDRKLQDGILRGARMVIARELQMAAREIQRTGGGRYTRLTHVVASSCQICAEDPIPLWEIRARSITHDAQLREISLEAPQFRAFGVPVWMLPFTITAPDPTVERRTGFLRPEVRTTSSLGFGMKFPYFITLGRSADLTLTPYLSASQTRTLEARYRQAFANGALQLDGAVTRDDIEPDETRGYLFGAAQFDLPRGYRLGVQIQTASDRAYLLDYDITDADRLWSGLTVDRVTRDKLFAARVGNYETLRDGEDEATSPAQVADVIWQRRLHPSRLGGEALLEWSLHAHRRPSSADQIGRDMARASFGPYPARSDRRDMARASFGLDWRRSEILPAGFVGSAIAAVDADFYHIVQDSRFDRNEVRVTPTLGAELRWPLMNGGAGGVTHLVEPVAQVLWSPDQNETIPNEDSALVEFDEGNLFAISRFPGWDARETGLRANLGVSWTRIDPTGWSLGVTAGRVLRNNDAPEFGPDSPLGGRRSDWLLATHFDSGTGLALSNRALFDDSFSFSRNELRAGWAREGLQLSAGYLWVDSDPAQGRDQAISEATFASGWQVKDGWWASTQGRYDFTADRMQKANLGLQYRNECITVAMDVERRFTSSDSVRPETDFGLSVRLGGFGRQSNAAGTVARRSCMR